MITFYKKKSLKNYLIAGLVVISTFLFTKNSFAIEPVQSGTKTSTNGIFNVTYSYHDNSCSYDAQGTITILTINGASTLGYTFKWQDNLSLPSNQNLRINLPSQVYTVEITEIANPANKDNVIITIASGSPIIANETVTNQKCVGVNDGSITLTPSGGTPFTSPFTPPVTEPYKYTWASPIPVADRGNSTVTGLAPNTYSVNIEDSKGCIFPFTFTILPTIPVTQVDTLIVKSNTCNGASPSGSIKIEITGGKPPYTYKWDLADPATGIIIPNALPLATRLPGQRDEDDVRQNLNTGYYVVTVTDANLCATQLPALDDPDPSKPKTYHIRGVDCLPDNPHIIPDPLMSPNGDGLGNEFFKIEGIEKFPDNQVIIYNRWGMEVFTKKQYNNLDKIFTGTANSALTNTETVLVDGVYYYTIRTIWDKKPRLNKGFIILKR